MKALLLFLFPLLLLASSIDQKIERSKKRLQITQRHIKGLNLKLSKIARNIKSLQKSLDKIDRQLETLNSDLAALNDLYKKKMERSKELKKRIKTLTKKEGDLKQNMVLLISHVFSKSLLLSSMKSPTQEDIFQEEILKAIQSGAKNRLQHVSKEYLQIQKRLEASKKELLAIESQIKTLLQKQSELKRLKLVKAKKIKQLQKQKSAYDKELQALLDQRKSLAKTLERLKIIKSRALARKSSSKIKVKKYGEKSYQKLHTIHYRGPKTIPPLQNFVITKRYGVYKDPIYNIEIPNENIELKPLSPNAKVRNVLNGRIILAKWTPHLKNVVIVKHPGGLYTIYAYLDKLAPYIKKGRKIKKGYIIGRVSSKLIFEVTKNNAHINPLELIKVR